MKALGPKGVVRELIARLGPVTQSLHLNSLTLPELCDLVWAFDR
jgi:hypothetical protein